MDNRDDVGMTGTTSMLSPLSLVETTETTGMGDVKTTWEPCGDHGDDMGMMWGQQG